MNANIVFSGILWRFAERVIAQLVSFVVSILLARILMPTEYGTVAMTMVFITVCNVFVTSGFGVALIQKKEVDELDFSTILICSEIFSLLIYIFLFLLAPYVAIFYDEKQLKLVLRLMALRLPIAAINTVQNAYVARKLLFRKLFFSTFLGTIISGIIGIILACNGYGVWALVIQYLANSFVNTLTLSIILHWFPNFAFSFNRLKSLISFGWKILCSDLINTIYHEVRNLIIGKKYSSEQLAYYNRGSQIPHLFVTNIGVAMTSVLFPVLSKSQNDKKHLKEMTQKAINLGIYIMFPLMTILSVISRHLIVLLLGNKWLNAVPYLQLACIFYAFEPWSSSNLQALKACGEAKKYLYLEIKKKIVAIFILIISVPFGVYVLAASASLYSFLDVFMTAELNRKVLKYGFFQQLSDNISNILITAFMSLCIIPISFLKIPTNFILIIQIFIAVIVYWILSILTKNQNYLYLKSLFSKCVKK